MTTDTVDFFDLAGKSDDLRFSPHCWKTRMALAHKAVSFRTIPWRYSDKELLAFTGQGSVPVIRHKGQGVADSWRIALYLEREFADRPALFGGSAAIALTQFVNTWVDTVLIQTAARIVMLDVHNAMLPREQHYFRSTREKRFGMTLEELVSEKEANLEKLRLELAPLRNLGAKQPFLGGERPMYADYCVFGMFMWMRCCSDVILLDSSDPVYEWNEKMLDLFDGLARRARHSGTPSAEMPVNDKRLGSENNA
jgi:glutathione S-transferase